MIALATLLPRGTPVLVMLRDAPARAGLVLAAEQDSAGQHYAVQFNHQQYGQFSGCMVHPLPGSWPSYAYAQGGVA